MIRAVVSGALARQPEERLSESRQAIHLGIGPRRFWRQGALDFSFRLRRRGSRETISNMAAGDAIAVSGEIDAEVFTLKAAKRESLRGASGRTPPCRPTAARGNEALQNQSSLRSGPE